MGDNIDEDQLMRFQFDSISRLLPAVVLACANHHCRSFVLIRYVPSASLTLDLMLCQLMYASHDTTETRA